MPADRMREVASAAGKASARGHGNKFSSTAARAAGKLGLEVRYAPWWIASEGGIALRIIRLDAVEATPTGPDDAAVLALSRKPYVHRQLQRLQPADVRAALRPYGAWSEYDLRDHKQNLQRLLWVACGDIKEGDR